MMMRSWVQGFFEKSRQSEPALPANNAVAAIKERFSPVLNWEGIAIRDGCEKERDVTTNGPVFATLRRGRHE